LTGDMYLELLEDIDPTSTNIIENVEHYLENELIFQQDGTPLYYARFVREYLDKTFPGRPSRQTISNLIARARDGRLRCQRKKKDRTEDTVLNIVILGMVAFNPHVCQRKISLELNTSLSTVNRVLRARRNAMALIPEKILRRTTISLQRRLHMCPAIGGDVFEHLL
ncbi:hypothetical protein ALC57_16780, partial [Trachymyrmex cornetzi]